MRPPYAPTKSEKQRAGAQFGGIIAKLTGSDTATALGLITQSSSPVIDLCRLLIRAGHDPATPLEAYRGPTLCLRIRSIGEAARLRVRGDGHGFEAECRPTAASIAPNVPAHIRHPDRARRTVEARPDRRVRPPRRPMREAAE